MKITPRPYQDAAAANVWRDLVTDGLRSTLVVLPTGCGKTVLFGLVAKRWISEGMPGRVLVLAHREELIRQAIGELNPITGFHAEMEMAESRANPMSGHALFPCSPVVVASVQSLVSGSRLQRFGRDEFGLVIIDEAHHATAGSYRKIIEYFTGKVLGVTATPKRADDVALGKVFGKVSYEMGIREAVDDGYLCPVQQRYVVVEELNLSVIQTVAGDFHQGQLGQVLTGDRILDQMVSATVELCAEEPTLIFTAPRSSEETVSQGEIFADALNKIKPGKAVFLSGETEPERRRHELEQFNLGHRQFLIGCALFTEGFNAPQISRVVMARPTKSIVYYTQSIGRGTRTLRGVLTPDMSTAEERKAAIASSPKPHVLVIDFVGNSGKHKLISAVDIFAGKASESARERAKKLAARPGCNRSIDQLVDEAEKQLAKEKRDREEKARKAAEERERRAKLKIERIKLHQREVDPYTRSAGMVTKAGTTGKGLATADQVSWINGHGGYIKPGATAAEAGAMIAEIKRRWTQGLCSPRQERSLKGAGLISGPVPKDHAGALMDLCIGTQWTVRDLPRRDQCVILPSEGGYRLGVKVGAKVVPVGKSLKTPDEVRTRYRGLCRDVAAQPVERGV